jgi:uncharacterized membrane protein
MDNNYNHNDSAHWIWGVFYFNREDNRVFPPKRIKEMGWTVNFANPYSVIAMVAVIALFAIAGYLFKTYVYSN